MSPPQRRHHPRVDANLDVQVRTSKGTSVPAGRIRNVSLGGVFIEMDDLPGFGTEFNLTFSLPVEPRNITCTGYVVWTTKDRADAMDGMQGVGVRLADIGVSEMRALKEFIDGKTG